MIAVICTDGQLQVNNIQFECVKQKWIPILILKEKVSNDIVVPIFTLEDTCYQFIIRNLPKQWKKGCIHLSQDDYDRMKEKNWKFLLLDFPRKFVDHPNYEMGFEVHDFSDEPDFVAK